MLSYALFFLGATIVALIFMVVIQLSRIERNFKELYLYTERKVKIFFETEEDLT